MSKMLKAEKHRANVILSVCFSSVYFQAIIKKLKNMAGFALHF